MRWELSNPKTGQWAEIEFSEVAQEYHYQVQPGYHAMIGYNLTTKATERGWAKTLKGAKSAVSQRLFYKTEWTSFPD